jgi:hypothetical protein
MKWDRYLFCEKRNNSQHDHNWRKCWLQIAPASL